MRNHAAQWPASAKKVDPTTAALSRLSSSPTSAEETADETEQEDDVPEDVASEYLETDDPDPTVQAGIDDEIPEIDEGEPPWTFAPPGQRMSPEERGAALMKRLQEMWDDGARDFSSGDLRVLWETTDISRAWVQKQLKRLAQAGILGGYDDERQRYLMPERPEVE
jgi:biotin operon repressor